jgi:hypothetical protein
MRSTTHYRQVPVRGVFIGSPMLRYVLLLVLLFSGLGPAVAQETPWRATVYAGTITRLNTTQIFLHGHYHPDGSEIGVALSRDLAPLASGFTFVGEGGVTQQVAKGDETTANLGIGARYDFELLTLPVGISAFTGPSWAEDPPVIPTGTWHGKPINFRRNPWLNYVGTQIAVALTPQLAATIRYDHRSGAFGLFAPNADEGSALGFGVQIRF